MTYSHRIILLAVLSLSAVVIVCFLPPLPQDRAYHAFVDQRPIFGVSNFFNVVSNIPFLIVGIWGMIILLRPAKSSGDFRAPAERWPYVVMFLGTALTAFGSAYYHLAPGNETLAWDRLPMTLIFMGFLAAVIAERISLKAGLFLLPLLTGAGVGSVLYWRWSETMGQGDLRPYALIQFYPMIAIPLIIWLFPPKYNRSADLWLVMGLYAAAKVFEVLDAQIFSLGLGISGHTVKHIMAAGALWWLGRMLKRRRVI